MGNVTKSGKSNITSPNGNSLALFVDGDDDVMKVKDVRGNVQKLSDFKNSPYLYAVNENTQDTSDFTPKKVFFNKVVQENEIFIKQSDNSINVNENGLYSINLSLEFKNNSLSNQNDVYVWSVVENIQVQLSLRTILLSPSTTFLMNYNIILSLNTNEKLFFYWLTGSGNDVFMQAVEDVGFPLSPSCSLIITKID